MIKFRFAEIVNEDGSVRRLQYPVALTYRESLKENLAQLAKDVRDFPPEPSHLNYNSCQLNRHLRPGESPSCFLPRSETDLLELMTTVDGAWQAQVRLTPYFRWKTPELRGGTHFTSCLCMKRNGMQVWCPRWRCRGSLGCVSGRPGVPSWGPRQHPAEPLEQVLEPSCCESWLQRAKEADMQLYLFKKRVVEPRGLY